MRNRWILPALLGCIVSCGEPGEAPPASYDLVLELVTDTVFVVGDTPFNEGDHYFGRVVSLGFDRRGRLHVFDPDRFEITTWDERGRLVSRFGNKGEGPHEFKVPRYAHILRDGTVLVLDIGHARLLVYGPGGRFERGVRLPTQNAVPGSGAVLAADRLVGEDDYWLRRPVEAGELFSYQFGADSVVAEPFYQAWAPAPELGGVAMVPEVRIAPFSDGRVALADNEEYRLRILSRAGELVHTIGRPVGPPPVTDMVMDAERERRKAKYRERDLARGLREMGAVTGFAMPDVDMSSVLEEYHAGLADLEFADDIPVIHTVQVDWNDQLWITRSGTTGEEGPIDLMSADGRYEGTLYRTQKPDAFGPNGLLAYVDYHELGPQSVVVVRITAIAPAVDQPMTP